MGRQLLLYALTAACILLKPSQGSPKDMWPLNGDREELLYNIIKGEVTKESGFVDDKPCPLVSSLSAFGSGSSSFYYNGAGRSVADLEVEKGDYDSFSFTMFLKPDSAAMASTLVIFEYHADKNKEVFITRVRGELVSGHVKFIVGNIATNTDYGSLESSVPLSTAVFNRVLMSVDISKKKMYLQIGDTIDNLNMGANYHPFKASGILRVGDSFASTGAGYRGHLTCVGFFDVRVTVKDHSSEFRCSEYDGTGSSCPLFDPSQSATTSAALTTAVTPPEATTTNMDETTAVTTPVATTTSMDETTAVTPPEATTTNMDETTAVTTPVATTTSIDETTAVTTPEATTTSMDETTAVTPPEATTTNMDETTAVTTPVATTTSMDETTAVTTPEATTTSMDETTAVTTPEATTTSMDETTAVTTPVATTTNMDETTAVTTPEATTTSMDETTAVTTPVATTTNMDETTAVTTPEATTTNMDETTAVTTPVATTTSMDVTTAAITPEATTTSMDVTTAATTPEATTTSMAVTTAATTPEATTTSMDVTTAVTTPEATTTPMDVTTAVTTPEATTTSMDVTTAVTTPSVTSAEPTIAAAESSSTPSVIQTTESSSEAAPVPTTTAPSSQPQPVYLWPLDDVTGAYDIMAGSLSLTSLMTRTCFRTNTPSPDVSLTKSFLLFDGSLDSSVKMEVESSAWDDDFTVVVFVKPQQPPEGLIWSYSSPQASLGISRIEVSLRYDGSLVMKIWDSRLQAPCGQIVAPEVFNNVSKFSTVIVGRNASAVKLQVDNNAWVGNDSCPMSTGNGVQGLMEVGGRGDGQSAGYRGHVVCMAVFSQYVSTLDDEQLLSQCGDYNPAPYLGVKACNRTSEIKTERFKLFARNKAPDVTTLPPMTSSQTSSMVKCAGLCLRTPHCKSFAFSSDAVTSCCSLFDVVTLTGLGDSKGNYYEVTSDYNLVC